MEDPQTIRLIKTKIKCLYIFMSCSSHGTNIITGFKFFLFPTRNAFIFLLEHFLQTRPFFGAQCSFVSHAPFCIWSTNHTNGARIFGVCAPFGAYIIKLEHLFYLGMKVENWICLLSSNQSSSLYPINQWECLKLPLHWTHVHKTVST